MSAVPKHVCVYDKEEYKVRAQAHITCHGIISFAAVTGNLIRFNGYKRL